MSTELATLATLGLTPYTAEDFDDVASSAEFFGRIQLMGSNSKLVAQDKMKQGYFAFIKGKDDFTDLSKTFDAVALSWHPKALKIQGENVFAEYDRNSPNFTAIKDASKTQNSGCMFGPEFFLWVPSVGEYATFHMANATARREAQNLIPFIMNSVTISSKPISSKGYNWHGPVCTPCTTPLKHPDIEEIKEKIHVFLNPTKSDKTIASEPNRDR